VAFTKRMFDNYTADLEPFSNWQLAMGLSYVFNNNFSDMSFKLKDSPAPLKDRLATIRSMKILYEECFAKRCPAVLGHYSETTDELGIFCYMIWDTTSLSFCTNKKEKTEFYTALFEVFEAGLKSTNIACIESALHGLGHLVFHYKPAAHLIEANIPWVRRKGGPRLLAYAKSAKTGMIQ
ncbi:MAG: hypothetical protein AAF705_10285, partial [Bacteroidota bacterium]